MYYNSGEKVIPDEEYDQLVAVHGKNRVGVINKTSHSKSLPYRMYSLEKVHAMKSGFDDCISMYKLDGVAGQIEYDVATGELKKIYLRGDKFTGTTLHANVVHQLLEEHAIPFQLRDTSKLISADEQNSISVIGEFVIRKEAFKQSRVKLTICNIFNDIFFISAIAMIVSLIINH
jgi:NAD-dependent DNA ligase